MHRTRQEWTALLKEQLNPTGTIVFEIVARYTGPPKRIKQIAQAACELATHWKTMSCAVFNPDKTKVEISVQRDGSSNLSGAAWVRGQLEGTVKTLPSDLGFELVPAPPKEDK